MISGATERSACSDAALLALPSVSYAIKSDEFKVRSTGIQILKRRNQPARQGLVKQQLHAAMGVRVVCCARKACRNEFRV